MHIFESTGVVSGRETNDPVANRSWNTRNPMAGDILDTRNDGKATLYSIGWFVYQTNEFAMLSFSTRPLRNNKSDRPRYHERSTSINFPWYDLVVSSPAASAGSGIKLVTDLKLTVRQRLRCKLSSHWRPTALTNGTSRASVFLRLSTRRSTQAFQSRDRTCCPNTSLSVEHSNPITLWHTRINLP